MAQTTAAPQFHIPLITRIWKKSGLNPGVCGLILIVGWYLLFIAYAFAVGWPAQAASNGDRWWTTPWPWWELHASVMIGYLPSAAAYALRGARRDLLNLRPLLNHTPEQFDSECQRLEAVNRRPFTIVSLAGLVFGLALPFLPAYWADGRPTLTDPVMSLHLVRSTLTGWLAFVSVYITLNVSGQFARLGALSTRIDLLDLGPLRPFTRVGLRNVLLLMVFASILSIQLIAPWPRSIMVIAQFLLVAASLGALMLPVQGIHYRIRTRKEEELERIREMIREQRNRLESKTLGGPVDLQLANLIAYEQRIAAAPTWPFDLSTYFRLGLYVALGLGSWLGAALVERVLDGLLNRPA